LGQTGGPVCYNPQADVILGIMPIARRYLIRGRVQRVGFRLFAQDAARREGIQGLVRNLPDGRVEVTAEGEAEAMLHFEMAIRHGPLGARIDEVDTEIMEPTGRFFTFRMSG
jgi:acylphosphatase